MNDLLNSVFSNDTLLLPGSDLVVARQERPLVIKSGRGIHVFDEHGREYIEAVAGFSCVSLGFSEEALVEAATRQMRALPMSPHAHNRSTGIVMELADRLSALSPVKNARIAFATNGSEANDNLVKMMWYANGHAGESRRRKIISRRSSYHGSSIFTAGMGGTEAGQRAYGIPLGDHIHVSQPFGAAPGETDPNYVARLAAELCAAIEQADPSTVAAFIAEPMSFSADVCIPPPGYFPAMKRVLDEYGIALIADEVLTGAGRTGEFWGCTSFDIQPDFVTSSKGLSSAYQAISAIFMSPDFYDRLERASVAHGWYSHTSTYQAHPVAVAVALKVLDIWEERDLVGHVRNVSPYFKRAIATLEDHPLVAGTRSFGLMSGVMLRPAGTPGATLVGTQPPSGIARAVYEEAFNHGLILRTGTDMVKMTPPIIITTQEIDELVARLRRTLDAVLSQRGASA